MKKYRRSNMDVRGSKSVRGGLVLLSAVASIGVYAVAGAFEIPTGNEDIQFRWDNTLRYTYGHRISGQNPTLINSANNDDGDRNFNVGTISNRLDILSETDFVYKKDYGVRFSGALWYDQRYGAGMDNSSIGTSNHIVNGAPAPGMSDYAKRYYKGPSGELLDAFAFGKITIGDIPINLKVGRHTVYWGEAMFGNGGTHGISFAQSAIDISKGLGQPSLEVKELFRPRNQVSMQVQPTKDISIAANYYLQWEPNRVPESGTYLGFADPLGNGSESLAAGPFRAYNKGDIEPGQAKDFGVAVRWSPEWLAGTLGLYYRKFSDVNGQLNMRVGMVPPPGPPAPVFVGPVPTEYRWSYASGIDLYGISLSKQFAGISIGSELSYRHNMPLWSNANVIVTSIPGAPPLPIPGQPVFPAKTDIPFASYPSSGDTGGARGDTWHALVNFLYLFPKCALYDTATGIAEFTWSRLDHVTSHPELLKWGNNTTSDVDRITKDFVGGQINFEPTWFQVLAGVDLSMPMTGFVGLVGNSAVTGGGTKNAGTYSVGFTADFFQKYKANLSYIGFFGPMGTPDPSTGEPLNGNGPHTSLKDRNMITLTLKTSF